jgi:hypothetical protein
VEVPCKNAGETAIGGGISSTVGRGLAVAESVPNSTTGPTGWKASVLQTNFGRATIPPQTPEEPTNGTASAYVICTSQPVRLRFEEE